MLLRCFVGSNNTAHRIKKAYIGDQNGKAQIMYNPELTSLNWKAYINSGIPSLTNHTQDLTAISNTTYAMFAGGQYNYGSSTTNYYFNKTVDCYNKSLAKSTAWDLTGTNGRHNIGSVLAGDYALFFGGIYYFDYHSQSVQLATVDAYSINLIKTNLTDLSIAVAYKYCAASVDNYALINLGSYLDIYSSNLVKSTSSSITNISNSSGTSIGNYAIFGGGYDSNYYTTTNVYTYTSSLVKGTAAGLSASVREASACNMCNYALIAGGSNNNSNPVANVNIYDKNLTKTNLNLSYANSYMGCGATKYHAIFAGGSNDNSMLNVYNYNLIVDSSSYSTTSKYCAAGTSIGDFILIGGGHGPTGYTTYDSIDVYQSIYGFN